MTKPAPHPNILFIMTDQQRFDALSCHGGWVKTPNLDQLAATGADLQAHFSQAPVCVPSRCSLFSGRYGHAHRVLENDTRLGSGEAHLFKVLKNAGYTLGYSGKNHLLPEREMQMNFDRYRNGQQDSPISSLRRAYRELESEALDRLRTIGSYASAQFHDFPDDVTTTGVITRDAIDFLNDIPADQPWCNVVSYYDPHVPHLAPRRFGAKYPLDSISIPDQNPDALQEKAPRMRIKYISQNAHKATDEDKRTYLAVYASMCSFLDEQIGHVLKTLADRSDAANTMIVFLSDHGEFGWHHGLCKKDLVLYDDLIHVPTIFSWPGIVHPKRITDTLTEHVDILPTLLELAGIPIPFGCQGKSMTSLLRGQSEQHRETIHAEICYPWMRMGFEDYDSFMAAWHNERGKDTPMGKSAPYNIPGDYAKCVRTKRWKYIWYGNGFEELYDLEQDPQERVNLSGKPEHASSQRELRNGLFLWLAETADPHSPASESNTMLKYPEWDSCPGISRRE